MSDMQRTHFKPKVVPGSVTWPFHKCSLFSPFSSSSLPQEKLWSLGFVTLVVGAFGTLVFWNSTLGTMASGLEFGE